MKILTLHKRTIGLFTALLFIGTVWTLRAGDLDPPGPPSGTMRTLNEIYAAAFEPVKVPALVDSGFTTDAFLSVSDIPGSSMDENHIGWIDLTGYTFHVESGVDDRGMASPKFSHLLISKQLDKASVPLMLKACDNTVLNEVVLERAIAGGGKEVYYRVTLTHAKVTYISPMSARTPGLEIVAIGDFDSIKWEYRDPNSGKWQTETWTVKK